MGNSNTAHSKGLRVKSSKQSKKQTLNSGGRNLNVVLDADHAKMLQQVIQWHGGEDMVTIKEIISFLIRQECRNIPAE